MKKTLLIALIGLTTTLSSLYATQSLSFSLSGGGIYQSTDNFVLTTTDTFTNFGMSWGLSYWLEVNSALAPFLTITGASYPTPFNDANYAPAPTFPVVFTSASGADAGFLSTQEPTGLMRTVDLGGTGGLTADGSYIVTMVTFHLANAPAGTYTLKNTTLSPRGSIQVTSDFQDAPFAMTSATFQVVPEPSTLALLGLAAVGAGMAVYRRRKA